ncbi:MAG: sialate O-acetylesterase [Bacteroidota bacterium]
MKVFILAGQSNMEGQGQMNPANVPGTLSHFIANDQSGMFDHIQHPDGSWASRDDVWVRYDHGIMGPENRGILATNLQVGLGEWEEAIGPELGFGHVMGPYLQEQVLIIKTAWGGKSLAVDFRPPSSGGTVGPFYSQMIADIQTAINNISTEFPQFTGGQIDIAGFCWFQGWNDGESSAYLNEYEQNLKNLIKDVRTDLNSPNLPFVIGLTGNGGTQIVQSEGWVRDLQTILVPAQIHAAQSPEFSHVSYADTRPFWKADSLSPEPSFIHHWYNNAESFLRIGNELGLKMIEILEGISTSNKPLSKEELISLYPNPLSESFRIEGPVQTYSIKIRDIHGKLLTSFHNIANRDYTDISHFPKGQYFIEILNTNNERLGTKKIMLR